MLLSAAAAERRGRRVARLLHGAWRADPGPPPAAAAVRRGARRLLRTGAGGLGWWRIRGSPAARIPGGRRLHGAYAATALAASAAAAHVALAAAVLRGRGIEAIHAKGLAAARAYPSPGLRPCGDVDLYVDPAQYEPARAALAEAACAADLHRGYAELDDWPGAAVEARTRTVDVAGVAVRVFAPEDHLRLLALHLLRHGAWRPLWLCDVAALVEAAGGALDWDRLAGGEARRAAWTLDTLALARDVLGARLPEGCPAARRALPGWLARALYRQWGAGVVPHGRREPFAALRRPALLAHALRQRWPGPIEASVAVGAAFDRLPRLPLQVLACAARALRYLRGAPRAAAWR